MPFGDDTLVGDGKRGFRRFELWRHDATGRSLLDVLESRESAEKLLEEFAKKGAASDFRIVERKERSE